MALSQNIKDEIARLYVSGISAPSISADLKIGKTSVFRELKRQGIETRGTHDWTRGVPRKLSRAQIDAICSDYAKRSVTTVSLGEKYGVSRTTIQTWIRASGFEIKDYERKLSDSEIKTVIDLYESGASREELSAHWGVVPDTISSYFEINGVPMRDCQFPRQFDCNHDFFKTLTPESCYAIGFISADGCVSERQTVSIGLQGRDREILELLSKAMSSTYPITEYEATSDKAKDGKPRRYARFSMRSPEMVKDLIELGVTPRKSLTLKPCLQIPSEFERDYIRGLIDGDGWVGVPKSGRWNFGFCGSRWMVSYFQEYAHRLTGSAANMSFPYEGKDFARICYNGKRAPSKLAQEIYGGAAIALERKAEKAKIMMEYPL